LQLNLYNTLTETVQPVTSPDGIIRMYVCGVTPYDTTHLGHAFTFVNFDTLARYLEYRGFKTITVQNVTDIDDDILRKSAELGLHWEALVDREVAKLQKDMETLNVRPPDHYPRATQEIPRIIAMVSDLLVKGNAYEKNGSVYYSVRYDPEFGLLGHMAYPEMLTTANDRGNFPDDPNKRDPLDFVLWQATKPGEPKWDSPWGEGRPGWHIECSAMSMHYLGSAIEIHSGGADLIFPHHSCEIAQSEHFSGVTPFVKCWFHSAMVRLNGEKMSKSLGNMLFVNDLSQRFSGDAIRAYLLAHKYRVAWDADTAEQELHDEETMIARWKQALAVPSGTGEIVNPLPYEAIFAEALDDDFDTPRGIDHLDELADAILGAVQVNGNVTAAQATLRTLTNALGFRLV
jgi:L-cysteine:1D-myo-inositol 2-amino-2-deoxy-alpha-D-glucopyranoside ligase